MAKGREESSIAAEVGIDRDLLLAFVETVIPARGGNGAMPAASELVEFRDMTAEEAQLSYGPVLELILGRSQERGTESFASLDLEARESIVRGIESDHPHVVGGAIGQTLICYYGVDSVVQALGLEVRASHPQGHTLGETNWSLLGPVRKMDRIYKTTAGQGDES